MIVLRFAQGAAFHEKLISWYSHGPWIHVDAVLPNGNMLGARMNGGVKIRPPNYKKFKQTKIIQIPSTIEQRQEFLAYLYAQVGKPYDKVGIIDFFIGRDAWRDTDSWFCSELIAAAMEQAKIFPYRLSSPSSRITPCDLFLISSVLVQI